VAGPRLDDTADCKEECLRQGGTFDGFAGTRPTGHDARRARYGYKNHGTNNWSAQTETTSEERRDTLRPRIVALEVRFRRFQDTSLQSRERSAETSRDTLELRDAATRMRGHRMHGTERCDADLRLERTQGGIG
jgi:hypothetical protein